MKVNLVKLQGLIDDLKNSVEALKKKNEALQTIKRGMEKAWENDTCWNSTGRPIVQRIIKSNDDTIVLFRKTVSKLEVWRNNILSKQKKGLAEKTATATTGK